MLRTATLGSGSAGLGLLLARLAAARAEELGGRIRLDDVVGLAAVGLGALAATVLTIGLALSLLATLASVAGRSWHRTARAGAALTPRLLRRVVVLGVGTALAGATPALAVDGPPDLGWQVTTTVAADAEGASDALRTTDVPQATTTTQATTTQETTSTTTQETTSATTVVVRPGDCLWTIAAAHLPAGATDAEIAEAWPAWYQANRDVVGADPDLLAPGQRLTVPTLDGAGR